MNDIYSINMDRLENNLTVDRALNRYVFSREIIKEFEDPKWGDLSHVNRDSYVGYLFHSEIKKLCTDDIKSLADLKLKIDTDFTSHVAMGLKFRLSQRDYLSVKRVFASRHDNPHSFNSDINLRRRVYAFVGRFHNDTSLSAPSISILNSCAGTKAVDQMLKMFGY